MRTIGSVKALPCFLLLLSTCLGSKAQESTEERKKDLQEAKKHTQSYVNAIRPKLFVNLTGTEAKIYQSISFRITDNDHGSSAVGAIEDGQRIIEIGEGYGRQIEMMAEALIIESVQKRAEVSISSDHSASSSALPFRSPRDLPALLEEVLRQVPVCPVLRRGD